MDHATARILSHLTSDFYARVSSSFSDTRHAPWKGWERMLDETRSACTPGMRVLDIGCGNLRFERFLADTLKRQVGASEEKSETAKSVLTAWAFDNCAPLVDAEGDAPAAADVRFCELDIAQALLEAVERREGTHSYASEGERANEGENEGAKGNVNENAGANASAKRPSFATSTAPASKPNLADALPLVEPGSCDMAVAFGFAHHLPLPKQRTALLRTLVRAVRPGGYVVVSFWQFARSEKLLAKARATTAEGCAELGLPPLAENDYLLGWQHEHGAYRFCHHFAENEISELAHAACPHAREVARFSADGKTHDLNRYLVLQVR